MITLEDGRNEQACLTPAEDGLKICLSVDPSREGE
jgi:hypothetical protein